MFNFDRPAPWLIALDFDTPNGEARVLEIAENHGAIVRNAVPDALVYWLLFPDAADADELEAIRQSLTNDADVDFAL